MKLNPKYGAFVKLNMFVMTFKKKYPMVACKVQIGLLLAKCTSISTSCMCLQWYQHRYNFLGCAAQWATYIFIRFAIVERLSSTELKSSLSLSLCIKYGILQKYKTHCLDVNLNDQKTSHFYWCIPGMLEMIPK